jgi:uncharacterized Zn finger protein
MSYYYDEWAPYVSVAERRRQAEREIAKLRKKGHPIAPVIIGGRAIATTFWGKAWCENLESYRDFESRLPRGRSYVRNRAVLDLQIAPRAVKALVSGASTYKVTVGISAAPKTHWRSICQDCAGGIDSLVDLLQGRFSKGVMERLCRQDKGLFPRPSEIKFSCSCPDFASMCKHVAAVLYGVGARLDEEPELLFRLRAVDENDLLANLDAAAALSTTGPAAGRILQADDISALFGLEMVGDDEPAASKVPPRKKARARPTPVESRKSKSVQPAEKQAGLPKPARPAPKPAKGAAPPSVLQIATPKQHARKHERTVEPAQISPPTPVPGKPGSKSPLSGRRR